MPVVSLTDRHAAGSRLVPIVFQRHLETVLYGCLEGLRWPHLEGHEHRWHRRVEAQARNWCSGVQPHDPVRGRGWRLR